MNQNPAEMSSFAGETHWVFETWDAISRLGQFEMNSTPPGKGAADVFRSPTKHNYPKALYCTVFCSMATSCYNYPHVRRQSLRQSFRHSSSGVHSAMGCMRFQNENLVAFRAHWTLYCSKALKDIIGLITVYTAMAER